MSSFSTADRDLCGERLIVVGPSSLGLVAVERNHFWGVNSLYMLCNHKGAPVLLCEEPNPLCQRDIGESLEGQPTQSGKPDRRSELRPSTLQKLVLVIFNRPLAHSHCLTLLAALSPQGNHKYSQLNSVSPA